MSRTRKFQLGDVALWDKEVTAVKGIPSMTYFAIVVDYQQDGTGRGMYRVVRTVHPVSGATFGDPVWVGPHMLTPMYEKYTPRMTAVRVYRANKKLIERGCGCMCCAHEAIPVHYIRKDGSLTWDDLPS